MCWHCFRYPTLQPPDGSSANDEQQGNKLCKCHDSAKNFAPARIAPQELNKVALDPVEDHEGSKHLPVKLLTFQQPHQQNKIEELGGSFDQLRRLQGNSERRSGPVVRQLAMESDAPDMMGFFSITAARRKTTETPE